MLPAFALLLLGGAPVFERQDAHGLAGMYYGSVAVADFDGDGRPDLVFSGNFDTVYDAHYSPESDLHRLSDRVRLYRNTSKKGGPIRFELVEERKDIYGTRGSLVVAGDFDGDGKKDFAVEMRNGDDIAVWLNRGAWKFTKLVVEKGFGCNSTSLGMAAIDVDRDGKDDLVFSSDGNGTGSALWYRYDAKAKRFQPMQRGYPHSIQYGGTLAAGDLDGDGFPELAVGGNSRAPFGSHRCENLMIGETIHNRAGQFELAPMVVLGNFGLRMPAAKRLDVEACEGMDNAGMLIADLDRDRHLDVIIAGSATGFEGPPGKNGQQYDFAVLFNKDGTGKNFVAFEHEGPQDPDGTTNGGAGNVDFPNIAAGDLDGDGYPEVFVQGHRRDYAVRFDVNGDGVDKDNPYVFDDLLFANDGGKSFHTVDLSIYLPKFEKGELPRELGFLAGRPKSVGEGGQAIADFDGDGRNDLLFFGAELPFHTNGANARDHNDKNTIKAYVLRNLTARRGP